MERFYRLEGYRSGERVFVEYENGQKLEGIIQTILPASWMPNDNYVQALIYDESKMVGIVEDGPDAEEEYRFVSIVVANE